MKHISYYTLLLLLCFNFVSCTKNVKSGNYFLKKYTSDEAIAKEIVGRYVTVSGTWYKRPFLKPDSDVLLDISSENHDIYNEIVVVEEITGEESITELKKKIIELDPATDTLTNKILRANIGLKREDIESITYQIYNFHKKIKVKDFESFVVEKMCEKVRNEYGDQIYSGRQNATIPDSIITELFQVSGNYIYTFKKDATFVLKDALFKGVDEIQNIVDTDTLGQQIITAIGTWPVAVVKETKEFCLPIKGNFAGASKEPESLTESYSLEPYWP